MTIGEILRPADVNLALRAADRSAAIEEVLGQLRGDARVANWERLRDAIYSRDAAAIEEDGVALCIAHGRTDAVTGLVLAVGRSEAGVLFPETATPVHLVFVAGIPTAMSSEYLRLVGAIARVCCDPGLIKRLLGAADGPGFVGQLAAATERL